MYLLIIGWVYVVLMMALSEATSTQGTVMGAIFTLLLYGVLPLSITLYLVGTPRRRAQARKQADATRQAQATEQAKAGKAAEDAAASGQPPDGSGHAASDAVAPERKEP